MVPTNRPVHFLNGCFDLANQTGIRLIVACSKRVTKDEVVAAAAARNVEVTAVDLSPQQANPFGEIFFDTSTDEEILALTSGRTRDLSAKRNLGLAIARMCGWERLMFLDDDILRVTKSDVAALAAGLDNHNISVLIPNRYPDNSVVCHAHRLGGGRQGKFASAGAMGVRCDRDELGFFPNIYNEDWFFFFEEAANHNIVKVGWSRQRKYDPYEDPKRAVKEEFGDLLGEGLYDRLDKGLDLSGIDVGYWDKFIETRKAFLDTIDRLLASRLRRGNFKSDNKRLEICAAQVSISAARGQLALINGDLCNRFIDLWQADLARWQDYLRSDKLPRVDSPEQALAHLGLESAVWPSTR